MDNPARLALIATEFESDAGASTTANPSEAGYWKRIALAAEEIAGASTSANETLMGYMKRAAVAVDDFCGTDGSATYNPTKAGYYARMVVALEAFNVDTYEGSLEYQLYLAIVAFVGGGAPFAWDFSHDYTSSLPAGATYARTGDGTRVNSSGVIEVIAANNPRHGYDPVTLAARGLLIEKAATNLFANSINFNANWTGNNESGVDAYAAAPNGATAATRLIDNSLGATADVRYQSPLITVAASSVYSFSVFAKTDQLFYEVVRTDGFTTPADVATYFNTDTSAVESAGAGCTAAIRPAGGGWHRSSIAFTTDPTDLNGRFRISPAETVGVINVNRDGTSSMLFWGAQFELGAYPTSYIPTAGSTATRGASTLIDTTISYFNGAAGTFYWEGMIYAPSGDHVLWQFDNDTDNERHRLWTSGTTVKYTITVGGSTVADLTLGTYTPYTVFKVAAAFAVNDIAAIMSGGSIQTDTSATLPTVNRCRYFHGRTGNQLDGWGKVTKFDGTRLSDTTLGVLVA
jgi:hypothetical protein